MVSTQDSESCDPSSSLGGTFIRLLRTFLQLETFCFLFIVEHYP